MKNIISLFSLLLTVALTTTVFANGGEGDNDNNARRYRYAIKGVVVDEYDQPMPGATVRLVGTTFGAGTNSNGEFIIRLDETKDYNLQVSFMGYDPQTTTVTALQNPVTTQVKLRPSTNVLNDVVITGSFIEKPLKEAPVITRIISQKEIQALNPMTIETLLQYELPGLQIGYNSMSQQPQITYQGMGGEYMLFLIDGERVSGEGADHNVDFTRFNVDDIERIEVIKGAQSTIYGSNALGGVINIITKTANRPITANINARYAGSNGQKYTGSLGLKKDRLTSYSSLTYRTRDTYSIGDEGASTTVYGYNIWDFTQKLGYTCNEKLSVDLKGTYYRNQRDIRTGRLFQEYYVDYTFSGKIKYLPAAGQQITVGYIYDNYKKDNHYFRLDSTYTNYRNIKQTPRLDYSGKFGDHTISAGFEGDIEYLKHYMMKDSSHVRNQAYALFAQEDWNIADELNIVAGIRADYHEKYHWHVTPKISAMWHAFDFLTLRAGYARGFRSPSLKELYQEYDMGGLGMFMIHGNPDLKPETSNQYSASVEFNKGGFHASSTFTYGRFKNKIVNMPLNDGTSDMQYVNAENARAMAVESILRYRFGFGLIMTGSYAYTNDYAKVDGYDASTARPHTATFNAIYSRKFGKIGFNCSLNGQWSCKFDTYSRTEDENGDYVYNKKTYDARSLWTLNTGVTLPRGIGLNFGVDNLFNYKDKAADSSLQVPQKGISYIGTVNINIADMFKL
ncbi:TonB-dependent receptor [Bacteroides sp. 51]|uniref:TonB-dependent receptor n=1 Tax=Bacteroides sp. 51 TaxID=2302938 RepID=UPI0013D4DB3B|nr:TonB-dependent receptor [Bacteroides sp. 51]NDV82988.1 TonB-dependent receptor [Bacteroides sp. 51]